MRLGVCIAAVTCLLACLAAGPGLAASDPGCTGSYGDAPARAGAPVRFGIDPGLAGSAGGAQLPAKPDDPGRDLAAVQSLGVPGRRFVVRLNRLFWSAGAAGIETFRKEVERYTGAGFDAELQVRYHPPSGQAGDIPAWLAYVRHVVDTFGPNPRVVSMTITNEVNINFSPNTSDGYYSGAEGALIQGIEAAHAEAVRRRFTQLRFGFTYAYRFPNDASFFSYLGSHGGPALRRALGFVGLDFYPGSVYPPYAGPPPPGDSYRAEFTQAAGTLRDCFMPMAQLPASVPIWLTENGVPTGALTDSQQASALAELVHAVHDYSGTFNITDYRWFNLRDSSSSSPSDFVGPSFASDGLLRDDYSRKPSFSAYRDLIGRLGARVTPARRPPPRPSCRAHRRHPSARRRHRSRHRGQRSRHRHHRSRHRAAVRRSCGRSPGPTRRS